MTLFANLLYLRVCEILSPLFIILVILFVVIPFPAPLQVFFYASKSFMFYNIVRPERIELSTPALKVRCSSQLSYERLLWTLQELNL